VVIYLERGADLPMAQLMPLPLTLASVKSRLVLPFWCQLTHIVLDRGPLNGCVFVLGVVVFYPIPLLLLLMDYGLLNLTVKLTRQRFLLET